MRKISLYGLFYLLSIFMLSSCSKDIGNYTYHEINQVNFTDFQTATGYQAIYGDTLRINPNLAMSMDQNPNEANYTYEWSLRLGSSSAPPVRDSILAVSKTLKVQIRLAPGAYSLQYRVTDKNTGVQFQKRATLTVTTDVYEGYLVLNEVNGQSRLDMLSYKASSNSFIQYTDVLKMMGSKVSMQGVPRRVLCMQYTNPNITPLNYGVFIQTSEATNRLDQETFGLLNNSNIRNLFVGDVPANFAPQGIVGELSSGLYALMYLYDNGNVYSYSTFAGYAFKYTPLNTYSASGNPFKVAPYVITNGNVGLMYNLEKRSFVTAANYNSVALTDAAINYPKGYDLIYMAKNYKNNAFAILKDPVTSKYSILTFAIGNASPLIKEIIMQGFENARNFTLNPDWGYLFYSIGGKVYEYDTSTGEHKMMVDKGQETITYLDFQRFYKRDAKTNLNYPAWSSLLTVASYDATGPVGNNGTLEQYSVPPVNGQILKTNSWKGFGKIVSVSYRER